MIFPFKGLRPSSGTEIKSINRLNKFLSKNISKQTDNYVKICDFFENSQLQFFQDTEPCYYLYRLESQHGCQTGLVALVEIDDAFCVIWPHENIKKDKSALYSELLNIKKTQSNPVILLHKFLKPIQILLDNLIKLSPTSVYRIAGCVHKLWVINDNSLINMITKNYSLINDYYIGDGHHRYYAAKDVFCEQYKPRLLSWLISDNQARILPYNLAVPFLNSISRKKLLKDIYNYFELHKKLEPVEAENPDQLGLYINKTWYQLRIKQHKIMMKKYLYIQQFINEKFSFDQVIRLPINARNIQMLVDKFSYELAFTLPAVSIPRLLLYINKGYILPENTTYFVPKPAVGIVAHTDLFE